VGFRRPSSAPRVAAGRGSIVAGMTHPEVDDDGELSWHSPSPRLRVLRRWEVVGGTALAVVLAGAIALASSAGVLTAIICACVLLAGGGADMVAGRRVRAWGYAERVDDLLVRRGVMFRRLSVIPYGRMQYVELTAGPFERAFGLATVQMHTAAAASDARIPGLPAAEAARLRDQLTSLGEARAMGL
jgi:membrane protein YdbS with pleckstrin-like domain